MSSQRREHPRLDAGATRGSRLATFFFFGSLALGLSILLVEVGRPYGIWPNVSDDLFYYLLLARGQVLHGVVAADGLHPTNGFHPLYFLILRGLYPLVGEGTLPGVALALLSIAHAITCLVLWRTLRRLAGGTVAGVLAGLYAANPFVLRIVFAAVETSLLALCLAVCLHARLRWLESGVPRDRWIMLAALALAVAARTDALILATALALAPLLAPRGEHASGSEPRDAAPRRALDWAALAAGLIPFLVFGVWSLVATGEFFQVSGRALSFWQSANDWRVIREALSRLGAFAAPGTALVYALEVVVQFAGWLLRAPYELLRSHPLGWLVAATLVAAYLWRRERPDPPAAPAAHRLAGELSLFLLLLWASYALLFRHCQIWYWHGSLVAAAILAAIALARFRPRTVEAAERWLAGGPAAAGATIAVVCLACSVVALGGLLPRYDGNAASTGAAPADPLLFVPSGATVGAFDTGRLGWEQPRLTVVNLDGLVNNGAYRALRARRIGDYMREQGVDWLYVNDIVVSRFRPFGLDAWLAQADCVVRRPRGPSLYRTR